MDKKTLIECCIISNYCLYLKSFEPISLANTTTSFWQVILIFIKPKSFLARNITSQALKKMLKSTIRVAIFTYYLKRLNISFIIICRPC